MATYSNLLIRNVSKLNISLKINSLHTISTGIPYKSSIETQSDLYKVCLKSYWVKFYPFMFCLKDNYSSMKNLVDELNKNVEHAVKG